MLSFSLFGLIGITNAASGENDKGPSKIISVLGVVNVQGQDVIADVLIEIKQGQNANAVAQQVLKDLGLKPFDSTNLGSKGFTLIGFVWDQDQQPVVQSYNDDDQPADLNGLGALEKTHTELSSVDPYTFEIVSGETTSCPSLAKECPGPRFFDGENGVAWVKQRPGILGTAYFGVDRNGDIEVDVVLSLRVNWHDGCNNDVNNSFDVQTVFLHENAHLAGLGHSKDPESVLLANYHGADCDLGTDDIEGLTFLYDTEKLGTVSVTVLDKKGNAIVDATVSLKGTTLQTTDNDNGVYTITGVPDPVTYDITATKGDTSQTERVRISGSTAVEITLDTSGGGSGGGSGRGGACPPGNEFHPKCRD